MHSGEEDGDTANSVPHDTQKGRGGPGFRASQPSVQLATKDAQKLEEIVTAMSRVRQYTGKASAIFALLDL